MTRVLVVEDEESFSDALSYMLRKEGFDPVVAGTGPEALAEFDRGGADVVLLDLMLPGLPGTEVCRQMRSRSGVPIIMLTAKDSEVDKVVGLELGADDYVTKPFNPRELVARVKAVLRRTEGRRKPERVIRFADLTIDRDRREFRIGEQLVELRPKEFDLLTVLARRPGVVFPRERLRQLVWGPDFYGDPRTVDVHITWLRDKLSGASARIQTVWGVGYKLVEAEPGEAADSGSRRRSSKPAH